MSGRGVLKPMKKKLATSKKKRVARVKKISRSSILKNTVNIKLAAAAAPQLPGVSSTGFSGGGSSSSSAAGAPASTTIFTAGVRDDNGNDRILQALMRIEAAGPRAQAGSMQNTLNGERFIHVPGPAGRDGRNGRDSTVAGPQGIPGRDSTVAGPRGEPGRDSTVPGPQGIPGVSSFVYQPNGSVAPEPVRANLGRQQADVVPQDNSEDRLVLALERMAERNQPRLQATATQIASGAAAFEQPLAIEDAGRGVAQKRPANQLAESIDQQALAEANQMDTEGLRSELDMIQRQRRDVFRQAAAGELSVPVSGVGLTPETTGALVLPIIEQMPDPSSELAVIGGRSLVRAGPIIEQMPDPSSELAIRGGRSLVPDTRITAERSQQLARLRQQVTPPRLLEQRVATPPRLGGELVPRGTRDIQQFYPPTQDDFGNDL
jgi:hypothetical protein